MPVTPTYPGVYVQEVPSGVRTIVGVGTSITVFLGMAKRGPIGDPVQCFNYSDYVRSFSDDSTVGSLAFYVKLFFLNGGTNCYVMRIAKGATTSAVTLLNDPVPPAAAKSVLVLTAKDAGQSGDFIRAQVFYAGAAPEASFNIDLFAYQADTTGTLVKTGVESWKNLSMNPNSPLYAPDFLTQNSALVNAAFAGGAPAPTGNGSSMSGRAVSNAGGFAANWKTLLGSLVDTNRFQISVGGSPYVEVDLKPIVVGTEAALVTAVETAIQNAFVAVGIPGITVSADFSAFAPPAMKRLVIGSTLPPPFGDVLIRPGSQRDLAVPLMLGTAQGGIEVSGYANLRPAPSGISFRAHDPAAINAFANVNQQALTVKLESFNADGTSNVETVPLNFITAGAKMFRDNFGLSSPNGNSDGIREKFGIAVQSINTFVPPPGRVFPWIAEVTGTRLTIRPLTLNDNFVSAAYTVGPDTTLSTNSINNVQLYELGTAGTAGSQTAGTAGSDGSAPGAAEYDAAYLVLDKEVNLFNLMVLPPDASVAMKQIYPNASVFCQRRRAFLLMDPPTTWDTVQKAVSDVPTFRLGLVKDCSAIFYPRITIDDRGKNVNIGASGALAGLFARIDATRGVWKAPAGTEADLHGVLGLERRLSDPENGVINPRAINALRIFPEGIVSWGARTNDGDDNFASEWKYIPVRRLAFYIEESLYRGLHWAVFEPNDEPLWSQIRLNVGSFMHQLFRQGAFQGATPRDGYFVKCDGETTTQADRNLGIVNVWVGFAPLKPAEFIILYLQQMAGQIQV
jgi:phage tail sheath protein FI